LEIVVGESLASWLSRALQARSIDGRAPRTEPWCSNTTDVTMWIPFVDRLQARFEVPGVDCGRPEHDLPRGHRGPAAVRQGRNDA
jgi:hypothetical protein